MKTKKSLFGGILLLGAIFLFLGVPGGAYAAVYASPVAVWGVPVVSVVPAVTVPVAVAVPGIPVVGAYPYYPVVPGVYYYGVPFPGYVYTSGYYSLPCCAFIVHE